MDVEIIEREFKDVSMEISDTLINFYEHEWEVFIWQHLGNDCSER